MLIYAEIAWSYFGRLVLVMIVVDMECGYQRYLDFDLL